MQNKTKIIFAVSAFIIIAGIVWSAGTVKLEKNQNVSDNGQVSAAEKTAGGITYTGPGDLKIEQIPVEKNNLQSKPNLDRPVIFPGNYSLEARPIMEKKISDIVARLKNNSLNFDDWLNLGIYRKQIGDYEGAKEAWNYAGVLAPGSSIPFANLADLYGYYIKDVAMAEVNYLKAIEKEPNEANWYIRTAAFYREVEKDLSKAKAILEKGLKVIPNDPSLKWALNVANNVKI